MGEWTNNFLVNTLINFCIFVMGGLALPLILALVLEIINGLLPFSSGFAGEFKTS